MSSNDSCKRNSCNSSSTNSLSSENMDARLRRSSCNSQCSSNSERCCSSDHDYAGNQNCNSNDISNNDIDYLATVEADDHPSAEFARADDDYDVIDQVKSSDEDFTYSYCDMLAQKETVQIPIRIDENEETGNHNKVYEILNLIIHRLPGEKLGLNLKVEPTGTVLVMSVTENSAADRASDFNGNRCPIKAKDEIIEINGVSLNNMNNEDILSVVQELPLHVSLKLKRTECETYASPLSANENNESVNSGHSTPNITNFKIPIGYSMLTVYLSSLESKCIMPSDLKDCSDAEGLYKIQKNTLQIGDQDCLKKGDILFNINGEQLAYKNKFELVSKLSSLGGIAEVSILRKNTNCFGANNDHIPYHNGIFAQNSIKLAMRKYDKPSIKSNSEVELVATNLLNNSQTEIVLCEDKIDKSTLFSTKENEIIASSENNQQSDQIKEDESENANLNNENSDKFKATLVELKDLAEDNEKHSVKEHEPILSSFHSDNWLLINKKSSTKSLSTTSLTFNQSQKCLIEQTHNEFTNNMDLLNNERNEKKIEYNMLSKSSEKFFEANTLTHGNISDENNADKEESNYLKSTMSKNTYIQNQIENSGSFDPNEGTERSLTSSSCHSERSIIHLNCVVFIEDENSANKAEMPLHVESSITGVSSNDKFHNLSNEMSKSNTVNINPLKKTDEKSDSCKNYKHNKISVSDSVFYNNLKTSNSKLSDSLKSNFLNEPKEDNGIELMNIGNSQQICSASSTTFKDSPIEINLLHKILDKDNEECLPAYSPVKPTLALIDSEVSIDKKSLDQISSKYVSTYQIEIKNPIKQMLQGKLSSLKIVKQNTDQIKDNQEQDNNESSVQSMSRQLNEMTFNKEIRLNSTNSFFSDSDHSSQKEILNLIEALQSQTEITKIPKKQNELEKNISSDRSTGLNMLIEDYFDLDNDKKENTENDCNQDSLKFNEPEKNLERDETSEAGVHETNENLSIIIDSFNINLNEEKLDTDEFQENNEIQDVMEKLIEDVINNDELNNNYKTNKCLEIQQEDDNILDSVKEIIESILNEIEKDVILEKEPSSFDFSSEKNDQNSLNLKTEDINLQKTSLLTYSLTNLSINESSNNTVNDEKNSIFKTLKKLMHEELASVMKEKSSTSDFKNKTQSSQNSPNLDSKSASLSKPDLNDQQNISKLDSSETSSSLVNLNKQSPKSSMVIETIQKHAIPPAPPLPEKIFKSLSEMSSNNSMSNHKQLKDNSNLINLKNIETHDLNLNNNNKNKNQIEFNFAEVNDESVHQDPLSYSSLIDPSLNIIKELENLLHSETSEKNSLSDKSKKGFKWNPNDRWNTLITARPYNSFQNLSIRQNKLKSSSYSKTLMSFKRQTSPFSKYILPQSQNIANLKSCLSNCEKNVNEFPKKVESCSSFESYSRNFGSNIISSGINTLKNPLGVNLKNEKTRKEEQFIDYVESAFAKQIKQKFHPTQSQTLSGAALCGNGLVTSSINLNKAFISTSSVGKVGNNEEVKNKCLNDSILSYQNSIENDDLPKKTISLTELTSENNTSNANISVKEKIMLFTKTNTPLIQQSNVSQQNTATNSLKQPKLLIDTQKMEKNLFEPKISKSSLAISSPSINNSTSDFKASSSLASNSIKNSSSLIKSSFNNNNINDFKKCHSSISLNNSSVQQTTVSNEVCPILIKNESDNENQTCSEETGCIPDFRSVRDKIAYFSSKVKQIKRPNNNNANNIISATPLTPKRSQNNVPVGSSSSRAYSCPDKAKIERNHLANKIEIISSCLSQDLALKQFQQQKNLEDYDSLKYAYKLNALNNSNSNQFGKNCMNLRSGNKSENKAEVKQVYPSKNSNSMINNYGITNNHPKYELKSIIQNNENKISEMIENIETQINLIK